MSSRACCYVQRAKSPKITYAINVVQIHLLLLAIISRVDTTAALPALCHLQGMLWPVGAGLFSDPKGLDRGGCFGVRSCKLNFDWLLKIDRRAAFVFANLL